MRLFERYCHAKDLGMGEGDRSREVENSSENKMLFQITKI